MAMIDDIPVTVAPVFLPREIRWVVGVDLGQSNDPTAIAVLEHTRGVLDSNTPSNRHCGIDDIKQVPAERIDCRHLQRLELGMSYPAVVQTVMTASGRRSWSSTRQVSVEPSATFLTKRD
jgi:hypothetical protein